MPREKVLYEICNGAGIQFDPALIETFVRMDFAEFDAMLKARTVAAAA